MYFDDFPNFIMIEPTNYCNAQCPLCPTGTGTLKREKGYMDTSIFTKIINEIKNKGTSIILWNYGEPFIHKKIFDFISICSKNNVFTTTSTNGYLFKLDNWDIKLLNSGLNEIIISIDGASKEIHNLYRKNTDFDEIFTGLKHLQKKRKELGSEIKVIVQTIVLKHNENNLNEIIEMFSNFSDSVEFKSANLTMVSNINYSDFLPSNSQYSRYTYDELIRKISLKGKLCNKCSLLKKGLLINWDGTVNPCCYDYNSDHILGNISDFTIREIWNSTRKDFYNQIINDRKSISICNSCPVDLLPFKQFHVSPEFKD